MRRHLQHLFVITTVAVGIAGAGPQTKPTHPPANQSNPYGQRSHGRAGQRFLSEYDLNHDGKVTRDEYNKVTAQRYAQATGNGKMMDAKQFEVFRTRTLRQHADQSFRRADWNGDGKLTFDEFASPIRAGFERADKQSSGVLLCQHQEPEHAGTGQPRHGRRGGARGLGSFCARDDLNHDGKVTRAELDQALHQQFAAAGKSGAMNKDQFVGMQHSRAEVTSSRAFQRLDANHDGKLTFQEFAAAQQKIFSRMDKNGDGVITQDELTHRRTYANRGGQRG